MGEDLRSGTQNDEPTPVERGVLAPELRVVFVAFEPGPTDVRLRHHHARRNNQFWRLLAEAGLTPRQLLPEEDEHLPRWGIGLINPVSRRPAGVRGAVGSDISQVAPGLTELIAHFPPKVLAYTGKAVYLKASGRAAADWGRQPSTLFEGIPDLVVPSPSGRVRMTFAAKLRYYLEVAALVRQL